MNTTRKVYFISGVSGVGKSSVMKDLKRLLSQDKYDIRDFDERGVPDGGGFQWHNDETLHWLNMAQENALQGKSTIICGFNEPDRIRKVHGAHHPPFEIILLNATPDTVAKRLRGRYPTKESEKEIERASGGTLEKFIENCAGYAPTMRKLFEDDKRPIIDTDTKTPTEVAEEILQYIK